MLSLTKKQLDLMAQAIKVDPVFFAEEILGVTLTDYQKKILYDFGDAVYNIKNNLPAKRHFAIKSGHSVGKSFLFAVIALWFFYCIKESIVLITAPTFRQVRFIIWGELRKLYSFAKIPLGCELLDTYLKSEDSKHFILPFTSRDDLSQVQGFHAKAMLILIDESPGVSKTIRDAIDGFTTSPLCFTIEAGNAIYIPESPFYEAFNKNKQLYHNFTITSYESPFCDKRWIAERELAWGKDSPLFKAKVLGEFAPDSEANLVVPLGKIHSRLYPIEDFIMREKQERYMGVDVARSGNDETVFCIRNGNDILPFITRKSIDLMETAGLIKQIANQYEIPDNHVLIDEIGIGAGVVDRLHEQEFSCVGFNSANKPVLRGIYEDDHYLNLRAQSYFHLASLLDKLWLPDDDKMMADLSTIKFQILSNGKYKIASKEEIKKELGRSPDRADALVMACADFLLTSQKACFEMW